MKTLLVSLFLLALLLAAGLSVRQVIYQTNFENSSQYYQFDNWEFSSCTMHTESYWSSCFKWYRFPMVFCSDSDKQKIKCELSETAGNTHDDITDRCCGSVDVNGDVCTWFRCTQHDDDNPPEEDEWWHLRIRGNNDAYAARAISTIGYKEIELEYASALRNIISGECLKTYYSKDAGQTWTLVTQKCYAGLTHTNYLSASYFLDADASNKQNFKIKFTFNGRQWNQTAAFIDNFVVRGTRCGAEGEQSSGQGWSECCPGLNPAPNGTCISCLGDNSTCTTGSQCCGEACCCIGQVVSGEGNCSSGMCPGGEGDSCQTGEQCCSGSCCGNVCTAGYCPPEQVCGDGHCQYPENCDSCPKYRPGNPGDCCCGTGHPCLYDEHCCALPGLGGCDVELGVQIGVCFDCVSCSGVNRCSSQEPNECELQCGASPQCNDKTVNSFWNESGICYTCPNCNGSNCSLQDVCGLTALVTGKTCTSNGCSAGTTHTCNQANLCENQFDHVSCGGTTYYCTTSDGTSWNWHVNGNLPVENCTDGVDNDCDTFVDCVQGKEDDDCVCGCDVNLNHECDASHPCPDVCEPNQLLLGSCNPLPSCSCTFGTPLTCTAAENCTSQIDYRTCNGGSYFCTSLNTSEWLWYSSAVLPEETKSNGNCNDGIDNDCDGNKDTNDPNCGVVECLRDLDCNDVNPCTIDACVLGSCSHIQRSCVHGDDCCPSQCNHQNDNDCPTGDQCYSNADCVDLDPCTEDICAGTPKSCRHTLLTVCRSNDSCCPVGCSKEQDNDCTKCINASDCDDKKNCTKDSCVNGNCRNEWPACGIKDGCCSPGCNYTRDTDCTNTPPLITMLSISPDVLQASVDWNGSTVDGTEVSFTVVDYQQGALDCYYQIDGKGEWKNLTAKNNTISNFFVIPALSRGLEVEQNISQTHNISMKCTDGEFETPKSITGFTLLIQNVSKPSDQWVIVPPVGVVESVIGTDLTRGLSPEIRQNLDLIAALVVLLVVLLFLFNLCYSHFRAKQVEDKFMGEKEKEKEAGFNELKKRKKELLGRLDDFTKKKISGMSAEEFAKQKAYENELVLVQERLLMSQKYLDELNARADKAVKQAKTGTQSKEIREQLVKEGYSAKELEIIKRIFQKRRLQ